MYLPVQLRKSMCNPIILNFMNVPLSTYGNDEIHYNVCTQKCDCFLYDCAPYLGINQYLIVFYYFGFDFKVG